MYPMYLSSDYEDQAINLYGESGVLKLTRYEGVIPSIGSKPSH